MKLLVVYDLDACLSNIWSFSYWDKSISKDRHVQVHKCLLIRQDTTFGHNMLNIGGYYLHTNPSQFENVKYILYSYWKLFHKSDVEQKNIGRLSKYLDFWWGYPDPSLYIIRSALSKLESQTNNAKSACFVNTWKTNMAVKWRIMDSQPK